MYLLIVTGLSGAGKSLALRCLEEQGYFCVDNLPSSMLKEFVQLCNNANPAIEPSRKRLIRWTFPMKCSSWIRGTMCS